MAEDQASPDIAPETDAPADDFDKDRALATIKKLREFEKVAKAQAKELDELRAARKAADDATLSETERLKKRAAELEATVTAREAALAEREAAIAEAKRANLVIRLAGSLGAHDPADANILAAVADVDPSDPGAAKAVQQALDGLKKAKPYLFKAAGQVAPVNPAGGGSPTGETDAQRRARLWGGGGNIFDPSTGRNLGGGVVISQPLDAPVPK